MNQFLYESIIFTFENEESIKIVNQSICVHYKNQN